MDIVLNYVEDTWFDRHLYGNVTSPYLQRGHVAREALSLYIITAVGAYALYFASSLLNYATVFRFQNMGHAPFKGQAKAEMTMACKALPVMAMLHIPVVLLEIHGFTKLYGPGEKYGWEDYGGWPYVALNFVWFLVFTDLVTYWVHRLLHHRWLYGPLHKAHHLWKNPTPFASHAFHPVDGWAQGMSYHIFVMLFPMHKVVHLVAQLVVNVWSTSIHDGVTFYPWRFLNGAAHHTIHHTDFNYNYGQYFIFWDYIFGSYRDPREAGRVLDPEVQTEINEHGMTLADAIAKVKKQSSKKKGSKKDK